MPTIKDTLCLLAIVVAYGLTAYWDAREEQQSARASSASPPAGRTASDESPSNGRPPARSGEQHAQR